MVAKNQFYQNKKTSTSQNSKANYKQLDLIVLSLDSKSCCGFLQLQLNKFHELGELWKLNSKFKIKSNLHYTRGITPKRVTSSEAHLRGLAPGLHSSEETSQRWRAVGDTVPFLTGPGIEPQTSRTESVRLATELTAGFLNSKLNR